MATTRFVLPTGERISLTPRQLAVLQRIAAGDSKKEAAAAMSITVKTAKNYLYDIYQILGVHSRTEAVTVAMQAGIVIPPLPVRAPDRLTCWQRDKLRRAQRSQCAS